MTKKHKSSLVVLRGVLRCAVTVLLVFFIWGMVRYTLELLQEQDRPELSLEADLNRGDYSGCSSYLHTLQSLGEAEGEAFDRFVEFDRFYENYILYIEYRDAPNPEERQLAEQYRQNMKEIMEQSSYTKNTDHYAYLFSDGCIDLDNDVK